MTTKILAKETEEKTMKHFITNFFGRVAMMSVLATLFAGISFAQTTYELQQVTSVTAGNKYVFEQGGHVMNNTTSSSALQTTTTYATSGLNGTESYVWTLETASGGYYLKNVSLNSNQYLNNSSSTGVSFGNKNSIWSFNFQTDNTVLVQNNSNSNRFLGYTTSTSYAYKAYATSNLSSYPHAIKVYQLVEESGGYTVTYDANGGTGTMTDSNSPYSSGATVTVLSNSFSRSGYTFSKWNTSANGQGTDYAPGATFSISANTTLYAQWTSNAAATTTTIDHSGITNTDVYVGTTAGSLSASVTSGGNAVAGATVTWSGNNDAVATIDASTGVVTLVSAGSVTFTASYAGVANQYQSSTATYQMTVTDSTPYVQPTEFDINLNNALFGTNYNGTASGITDENPVTGSQDNVTVTYAGSGNHYINDSQIRFYPNNKLTFVAPSGYVIKEIVFTASSWGITVKVGNDTIDSTTKTWSGSATQVVFTGSGSSGNCQMTKATITLEKQGAPTPSISAENVNIDYDATSGSIEYTINNVPSPAGTLTASTSSDWLILGTVTGLEVPFTCAANGQSAARNATVTLTYTYGDNETVTKDVTVTQAATPVIYTTIPTLFNAATSTSTSVNITFGSWVISAVKGNNAYLTDNQGNGLIIYQNEHGFAVNDVLTGTVTCNLVLYQGSAELTGLTSSTQGLTVTSNGSVTEQTIAISALGGVNTGALVAFEDLTYNGSALVDGNSNTITPYTSLYNFGSTFVDGISYDVKGIYLQFNTTKEILPRSSADIEEVQSQSPVIAADDVELEYNATSGEIAYTVHNPTSGSVSATTSAAWISNVTVTAEKVTFTTTANEGNTDRTATFTLTYTGAENKTVTVTQKHFIADYATLPFSWAGGTKSELEALTGVTTSGLGSDYAASNAPYLVKFDGNGDYIQIKTDSRPGKVTIDVKMLGGGDTSYITVKSSSDGQNFSEGEQLTISGDQNDVLTLETSNGFASTDRYVKLVFTKGSNVGVGPITIAKYVAPSAPTVTVANTTINAPAAGTDGTITVMYNNITEVNADVEFYTSADATTPTTCPNWLVAKINSSNNLDYLIVENSVAESRNAYLKVYALDDELNEVYSELITITQAAFVVDYAVLPFEWKGGLKADFNAITGVTTSGLGSDYTAHSPYSLRFDDTGDYILVKTDSRPGKVTIGVKMVGGNSVSKITVQKSSDGISFTELEELSISGAANSIHTLETSSSFASTDRYIKLVFTKGSNVGVGPITITRYTTDASISVANDEVNIPATETDGYLSMSYENLEISAADDFDVQFYDLQGNEISDPDWIDAEVTTQVGQTGYFVYYFIGENSGEARTTYLKVFAAGDDEYVYSNLVTISQAAALVSYAALPFSFNGGVADIASTSGLTHEGLGSDYASSPKLKFDNTDDCLILQINEIPGTLSFDVQGHSFSDGTLKVQTSVDGVTYDDLVSITDIDDNGKQESINNLPANTRYIKWVYEKVSGNVGLGNILLTKPAAPNSIVLTAVENQGRFWTSFFSGTARYTLSGGAQAFTMNSSKQLHRIGSDGSVIPANTAVVIISKTASVTLTKSNDTDAVAVNGGDNILLGSDSPLAKYTISGTPYVMGIVSNVLGFYEFTGSGIPAMKAYYVVNE